MSSFLRTTDPEIFDAIAGEAKRERDGLELIPSENYASRAVREACGSVLTNKYAEGYPGRRFYGGQEFTDDVERLAQERAKDLFGAAFVNVQPHSGAQANMAVYAALLTPGDTVLGMDLSCGGHLTHGSPATFPAKIFRFVRYTVDPKTGALDLAALRALAHKEKPKILLAGFSSYTRSLPYEEIVAIAHEVGAIAMMDMAHIAGLIAGRALPSPLAAGFDIVTTTTHKTLRGPRGGMILVREREDLARAIDKAVFPGTQGGPMMHTIAAKAVALREASTPAFRKYAKAVLANARAMEKEFLRAGVALVFGGTENHMLLVDTVASFGLSGGEAQTLLDAIGITANKNVIPHDTRPPLDPSGLRFGTPALTTRGFDVAASRACARVMIRILRAPHDATVMRSCAKEVHALARTHPLPLGW